jgi:rRNA-processing protein FCF1
MLFVSDANIFIDLYKTDLLICFDRLGFTIATSDFVYNELNTAQKRVIDGLNVTVYEMDGAELAGFHMEFTELDLKQISYQDYSIFYYAKKYDGDVLSNDKRLRKFATRKSIPVKGLFYILDAMVSQGCISANLMVEKLILLKEINKRLPLKEIDNRIEQLTIQE